MLDNITPNIISIKDMVINAIKSYFNIYLKRIK